MTFIKTTLVDRFGRWRALHFKLAPGDSNQLLTGACYAN